MRTGAKNVRARPFSPFLHTKTDFRDWSWKDKILINHISNYKKKFQPHQSVHMRTGAKNVRARAAATFVMYGVLFLFQELDPKCFIFLESSLQELKDRGAKS